MLILLIIKDEGACKVKGDIQKSYSLQYRSSCAGQVPKQQQHRTQTLTSLSRESCSFPRWGSSALHHAALLHSPASQSFLPVKQGLPAKGAGAGGVTGAEALGEGRAG